VCGWNWRSRDGVWRIGIHRPTCRHALRANSQLLGRTTPLLGLFALIVAFSALIVALLGKMT
jgi:hypothetical protein